MIAGAPPARYGHGAIYDPNRDRMWVTAGFDTAGQPLSDTWIFDPNGPAWTQVISGRDSTPGATTAVLDVRDDRLVVLTQSIVVEPGQDYERRRSVDAARWNQRGPLNTERLMPGWGFNEGGFRNLVAAAIGKNPPIVILPGTWPSSGHEIIPALRFKPLAPRPFVVSVTHLHFVPNEVRFALNFNFEHPLYDVVEVQRDGNTIDRRFPDENGNINVDEYAVPGTQQHYRISWFDGFTVRDTGDFAIDIPGTFPYPLDLGFSFDSTRYAGRSATTYMTVADDSARAPFRALVFERRVPPQDWREVFRGNLDLHSSTSSTTFRVAPPSNTAWGGAIQRPVVTGVYSVHVASDPQRESITVTPGR